MSNAHRKVHNNLMMSNAFSKASYASGSIYKETNALVGRRPKDM
jgi:hypothetical protein